jgi:hypothetical protein
MPLPRGNTLVALAILKKSIQTFNERLISLRCVNQIWLTGAIVAVIGFGSIVVIH